MSMRKHSFLFPLIVFVALLFFSSITNGASSSLQTDVPSKLKTITGNIQAGPGIEDDELKKAKLAAKIYKDYAKLRKIFEDKKGNYGQKMYLVLGKKATLVFENVVYRGKCEISDFWVKQRDSHNSVEFDLEWAFIVYEEKVTEEMDDYDHIAYESFTFRLLDLRKGEILTNQTGRGERSCRHTQICNCITR